MGRIIRLTGHHCCHVCAIAYFLVTRVKPPQHVLRHRIVNWAGDKTEQKPNTGRQTQVPQIPIDLVNSRVSFSLMDLATRIYLFGRLGINTRSSVMLTLSQREDAVARRLAQDRHAIGAAPISGICIALN